MKTRLLIFAVLSFVFLLNIGCENAGEINDEIDKSVELEEFILAGLDLQYSLQQLREDLNNLDMLALKPTLNSNGDMMISIPSRINIEEKTKGFNQKKKILLDKYPEFKKIRSEKRDTYIRKRIDTSIEIAKTIAKYNISEKPRLKSSPLEFTFGNFSSESEAFTFLNQQIGSPGYVEVVLVVFKDGNVMTVISNENTAYHATAHFGRSGEDWYLLDENNNHIYSQSSIAYTAHTHKFLDPASPKDIEAQAAHPGLPMYIYHYGGLMYDVDGNPIN